MIYRRKALVLKKQYKSLLLGENKFEFLSQAKYFNCKEKQMAKGFSWRQTSKENSQGERN